MREFEVNDGEILSGVYVMDDEVYTVHSGGKVVDFTLEHRGELYIKSGAVASDITIDYWSNMFVQSGGYAKNVTAQGSPRTGLPCHLTVENGGIVDNVTAHSGGIVCVESGGEVNDLTVTSGGSVWVSGGATVNELIWTPCIGKLYIDDNASVTYASQYSGVYHGWQEDYPADDLFFNKPVVADIYGICGLVYVMSGGSFLRNNFWYDQLYVWSGGFVSDTTIASGASMYMSSGAKAVCTVVDNSFMYVSNGALAASTGVGSGGTMFVLSGANANSTTVSSGGKMYISSGGVAEDTKVCNFGAMYIEGGVANRITASESIHVSSGGVANSVFLDRGGKVYVSSGGVADILETNNYGKERIYVYSGALVKSATLNKNGILHVSGGVASDSIINGLGKVYVSGGKADNTEVNSGGAIHVSSGGTVRNTTVNTAGSMHIFYGGGANYTTVDNGDIHISSGGKANITVLKGSMHISSGGVAHKTAVSGGGLMYISGGGTAYDTEIFYGGKVYVSNNAVANDTTVNSGAYVYVSSGGEVNRTVVNSGGRVYVSGIASNTTVNTYGDLTVSSGGKVVDTVLSGYIAGTTVSSGGFAEKTTVDSGTFVISSGGSADNTEVNSGGALHVSSGGSATNVVANSGAGLWLTVAPETYWSVSIGGSSYEMKDAELNGYTVYENGGVYVESDGKISNTTVSGTVIVSSGALATDTTIKYGFMDLESGGKAVNINIVDSGTCRIGAVAENISAGVVNKNDGYCRVEVLDGGVVNNMTLNRNGSAHVSGGAVVSDAIVNDGGWLRVFSGGEAGSTKVTSGGTFVVDGAVAYDTETDAFMVIRDGVASGIIANSGAVIYNNGKIEDVILNSDSVLNVNNVAERVTVSGGEFNLSSGAMVNDVYVDDNGYLGVSGTAIGIFAGPLARVEVLSNGSANSVQVLSGGLLTVFSGGISEENKLCYGGEIKVSSGGTVEKVDVLSGGKISVESGASASIVFNPWQGEVVSCSGADVRVLDREAPIYYGNIYNGIISTYQTLSGASCAGYELYVYSGGVVKDIDVNMGNLYVSSGGSAEIVKVQSGNFELHEASVSNVELGYQGYCFINGGSADNVTANGGIIHLQNGADIWNITMRNASAHIYDSSTAMNVILNYEACLNLNNSAYAGQVLVNPNATLRIHGCGSASVKFNPWQGFVAYDSTASVTFLQRAYDIYLGNTTSGLEAVYNGKISGMVLSADPNGAVRTNSAIVYAGSAVDTMVKSSGELYVSGGVAISTGITSAGKVYLSSGGRMCDTTVDSGGSMYITSGGIHSGTMKLVAGAKVTADEGAVIDFDISERTTADGYIINNLALISGAPGFTVTVGTAQEFGRYSLAGGASDFSGTITVKSSAGKLGAITVNGEGLVYDRTKYTLEQNGGALSIIIGEGDLTPPDAPIVSADITTPTNKAVTVTAKFAADAVKNEYRIGDGDWQSYVNGVVFTDNGTVSFRSFDAAENLSEVVSYTVNNIDKVAPATPVVSADITTPTNKNVTVTAKFAADAVKNEYRIGDGDWLSYINGVVFTDNGTVSFRSFDAAENLSEVVSYTVNNIDKVAPATPVVSADITTPTNKNVTVTAKFAADAVKNEYRIGDGDWQSYVNGVVFTENGTVSFRSFDAAENLSEVVSYTVNNIDKVAPATPVVSADITTPTNKSVTVTAKFAADAVKNEYKLGNGEWKSYTSDVVFTENGTVSFRSGDAAGNYTDIVSYTVRNIDKVAPATPLVSADITTVTNKNVTVRAAFSEDSVVKSYSFDNKNFKSYTSAVVMSSNGTVYFKAADAAGNVSNIVSYTVSNIDKTAPAKPIVKASTTSLTNKTVSVIATFSGDTVSKQYSRDNKTWMAYQSAIVFSSNGTVYFRGIDAAGNAGSTSYTVSNIDKVAPDLTISGNSSSLCRKVTLKAAASDANGIKLTQYSFDNKTWTAGTSVTVTKNGTVYFKTTDNAGNVTTKSTAVTKISTVPPTANLLSNGVSQIVGWDKAKGAVGFMATDGVPGNKWRGVWDWDGKDVDLWRVVGVGHFAGSKVDYDGILLYNGIGTTFAAWTNLNDPSYGYVNLCHVEGNFNTKCLTDLDSDKYDDVLIYDEKGSFGVVFDGATYKDIWHVDNAKTNPWQLCGAGSFGGTADKLVVKNTSGHLYLWTNNDPTFKTWNWSQSVLGYIGNDFEFVDIGDFKGDGKDDILLKKKADGGLWVWDDGNASTAHWVVTPEKGFEVEGVGDYNGDCKDDILVREYNTGWGGLGYYAPGGDTLWNDLNARIETGYESNFAIIV